MTGLATALRLSARLNYQGLIAGALALTVVMFAGTIGIDSLYPTAAERLTYSATAETLTSQHALQGPPTALDTTGGIAVFEVGWYLTIAVALLNIVLVVRNTRAQEASGRLELLRAGRFGAHANSIAVFSLAVVVDVVLGAGLALAMILTGAGIGAIAFGGSVAAIGVAFAGIAILAAQLTAHARGAYGVACAMLGLAYIGRALGDTVDSDTLRYLSPLGLAQAAHPFGDFHWWPLAACGGGASVAAAIAIWLEHMRDYDAGLLQPATGSPTAGRFTRTVPGLVTRTQKAGVIACAGALFGIGAGFGAAAVDAGQVAKNSAGTSNILAGFNTDVVDGFLAMAVLLLGIAAAGAVIAYVLALRAEETSGRADLLLSGTLSKTRFALTHLGVTAVAATLLLCAAGLGLGAIHAVRSEDSAQVLRLVVASLGQLPGLVFFAGLTIALIGLVPRLAWLPWVVLAASAVVSILGPSMDLPTRAMNVSVFHHVPRLPGGAVDIFPPAMLAVLGAIAAGVGVAAFTRRDLE
jgi:ABC-2 type transport system permease protein